MSGCPVLNTLVRRALSERVLSHDEQVVVRHSLGHVPRGVDAVNYVLGGCPGTKAHVLLKRPLTGNPISCPRIRQRVPHVTREVACHCEFGAHADHYPTPLLHTPSWGR